MAAPKTVGGYETLAEVSARIRDRQLLPVDLVAACLQRIERLQPQLNAFITVTSEAALEEARAAGREIREGRWKGPLHGIPVGIKDFYDTVGVRTTAAFEHFRNRIPATDAAAVEKLKRAGAIVIGKMNMHTLGAGTTGLESFYGPAKNPWNADYIPGGSSSGSAVAVASGLCYATLDTDAIGSCRLPAACCGVVGFKGTYGLIDMKGILEGERPPGEDVLWLSHAGITTRSAGDTALMLDVLAERGGGAAAAAFYESLAQERDLRIGIADNGPAETEVSDNFEQAVETIQGLGFAVKHAPAPFTNISLGLRRIEMDRKRIAGQAFGEVDVLLLPAIPMTTPLVADAQSNPQALPARNTMFANYYGLPAISVPCGYDPNGLPLGLQIVGKPGDDGAMLWLADRYQKARESSHPVRWPLRGC